MGSFHKLILFLLLSEKQGFDLGIPGSGFQGHFNKEGEYLADHLTDKAVAFIEENNPEKTGNPFFLYLAHHHPPAPSCFQDESRG